MQFGPHQLARRLLTVEQALELSVHGSREAAVLVPIHVAGNLASIVFTKRVPDLRHHAGEISFPGGRPTDEEHLLATALRETTEEIGLPSSSVSIAGALEPTSTFVTNYAIYPFVGLIDSGAQFEANPSEVERILTVPFEELAASYEAKRLIRRGIPILTDTYRADGEIIWGATARIVKHLIERLS